MPRRYARPDARDGDATSFDVQTHHPALKPRVSRSTSLVRRVTPRGSRIAIDGTDFSVFRYWPPFHFSCRARHASRAPDRARRAPLTSSRALRPSPCSEDTVERHGRARGRRRHPRGARDRAVRGSRIVLGTFQFFITGRAYSLFTTRDTRRFATAATDARGVSDVRDGRGARLGTRTRRPALKARASRSACTELRGNAARSRIADPSRTRRSRTNRSNRQSGSNFARCVFAALPAPLRGDYAASKRPFGRARRRCDLV